MMDYLGTTVMTLNYSILGIVVELNESNNAVKVRYWDDKSETYREGWARPTDVFARNVERTKKVVNFEDPEYWADYHEAAIDLALQTWDAEWFAELMSVRLMLKYF